MSTNILKCKWVAKQTHQAAHTGKVTVRSGHIIPVWLAFRCLYCGEYFSQSGAEEHFGENRGRYKAGEKETETITIRKIRVSSIR